MAAAVHINAQLIVAQDSGFDEEALALNGTTAQSPDDFLADLFDLNRTTARELVAKETAAGGITVDVLIDLREERGLIRFGQHLRR